MSATAPTTVELCETGCGRPRLHHGSPPFEIWLKYCGECSAELAAADAAEEAARQERRRLEVLARLDERLGPRLSRYTLQSYPVSSPSRAAALGTAREWLDAYVGGSRRNLILHGPSGEAKTGLAVAVVRALAARGVRAGFIVGRDWLDEIRRSIATEDGDPEAMPRSCSVLVLDDLGSERGTPFALEKLLGLIDYRYRQELPTIVTSNVAPSTLVAEIGRIDEANGERIVSRLVEDAVRIEFDFGNLRIGAAAA